MRNLAGQKFGRLTAFCPTNRRKNSNVVWECVCECGSIAFIDTGSLVCGKTRSCGCLKHDSTIKAHRSKLTGKKFGRLKVIKPTDRHTSCGALIWKCVCDCGNIAFVTTTRLTSGKTQSCGCLQRERTSQRKDLKNGTMLSHLSHHKAYKNNKHSKVRGVSWSNEKKKWRVSICLNYKKKHLGYFNDFEDAVKARRKAEKELFDPILKKYAAN